MRKTRNKRYVAAAAAAAKKQQSFGTAINYYLLLRQHCLKREIPQRAHENRT